MLFQITHKTHYFYQQLVSFCHNKAMLRPRDIPGQTLKAFSLTISPKASELSEYTDFFGNTLTHFLIPNPHKELIVTAHATIEKEEPGTPLHSEMTLDEVHECTHAQKNEFHDLVQYGLESPHIPLDEPAVREFAAPFFEPGKPVLESCKAFNHHIYDVFEFDPESTTISTPVYEVLEKKAGVCQDYAHLAIASLRAIGLKARYVSGYIETIPPEGQERLEGADASHAWFSVYVPDIGWVDFDPTNDQLPGVQHITVAWGRDYSDVPPLKGVVYSSGISQMDVSVDIVREKESSE